MDLADILHLFILTFLYVKCSRGIPLETTTLSSSLECLDQQEEEHQPECHSEGWKTIDKCSEDYPVEILKDVFFSKTKNQTYYWFGCCQEDASENSLTQWNNIAKNCQSTKCVEDSGDLCATLDDRYINGTKLVYEEISRDACTTSSLTGYVALCCRPNSKEMVLAAVLGAERHEFPHHVLVKPNGCGGTIYNKRFIISAAHCFVDDNGVPSSANDTIAVVGTNNHDIDEDAEEYIYKAKRIIIHEKYSRLAVNPHNELCPEEGRDSRYLNDVALVEMETDINFTETVMPLELAPKNFSPFEYASHTVVVGWGKTDSLQSPKYLQKTNLVLREDSQCFNSGIDYYNHYKGHENELLCIGGIRDGQVSLAAGKGDSGGPAICKSSTGNAVLCGITSFGGDDEDCDLNSDAEHCTPSVYMDASYYRDWIVKHAGKQNPTDLIEYQLYGEEMSRREYPHQVYISSVGSTLCGGTLIEQDVVVTAAHCVYDLEAGNNKVLPKVEIIHNKIYKIKSARQLPSAARAGKSVKNLDPTDKAVLGENRYKNDLAVVLLDKKVSIDENQLPILSNYTVKNNSYVEELSFPRQLTKSGRLVRREMRILKDNECRERLNLIEKTQVDIQLGKNEVCGVEEYSGGSICDRTLGGGLFCGTDEESGKLSLCGVQVYRTCMFSVPGIFIDTSEHKSWISSAVSEMKDAS